MAKGVREFRKLNQMARKKIAKIEKKGNDEINKQTMQNKLF